MRPIEFRIHIEQIPGSLYLYRRRQGVVYCPIWIF
jgi:hypothetical protein